MANRRIDYTIGFKPDKSGLNSIYNSLKEIKQMTAKDYMIKFGTSSNLYTARDELEQIQNQISVIETAYSKSFDSKLGVINLRNFNNELSKGGVNANQLFQTLAKVGKEDVFNNIIRKAMTANVQIEKTTSFLDRMGETLTSTVRWGISSRLMNSFVGSVKGSFSYIKELDTSLNNIRIVTGKSADEMTTFAKEANKAASALGSTTKTYTDASLIYFQQGLSDSEVKARAETTLKAANVTGQSGEEVSEQLTAVWNGYKVSAAETELYVDKLAAVAATTASNLEELSTGMSKVASAASVMGVDIDQLNGMLSTTISVTRQAPESVGTAFKTIFARIGDIEAGEGEVSLGEYTSKMKEIGFNVLDANNKLRNQGDVIEEIGNKWNTLSREQQIALAQTMAGARQYNNLLALFDNWNMYTKAVETSKDAVGTLQRQQDIHMESTEAHLKQLTAAQEQFQASLLDTNTINEVTDALKSMFNIFAKGVDALGGGTGVLLNFGSILTRIFSKQIATNIMPIVKGFQSLGNQSKAIKQIVDNVMAMKEFNNLGSEKAIANLQNRVKSNIKIYNSMSPEQLEKALELEVRRTNLDANIEAIENRRTSAAQVLTASNKKLNEGSELEITAATDFNSKEVQDVINERNERIDSFTTDIDNLNSQVSNLNTIPNENKAEQIQNIEAILEQANSMLDNFNQLEGLQFFSEEDEKATKERIETIKQQAENALKKLPIKKGTGIDKLPQELQEQIKKRQEESADYQGASKEQKRQITASIRDEVIAEYNKNIDPGNITEEIEQISNSMQEMQNTTEGAVDRQAGFNAIIEEGTEALSNYKEEASNIDQAQADLEDNVNLQKNIESVVQLTSNLSMGLSIMNNIAELPNIWQSQEDGATIAAQTLFNFAQTAIPAVVSGIDTIRTANTALQASMGWIGIIGMIIGAVVGIGQAIVNWQENESKARIENNKKIIEQNKARQEEIDSNTALYNSYVELEKKYKNGDISKRELLSSTDELIDAYDIENGKLLKMTGNYEALASAIKKKRLEEAKDKAKAAKEQQEAEFKVFKDEKKYRGLQDFITSDTSKVTTYGLESEQQFFKQFKEITGKGVEDFFDTEQDAGSDGSRIYRLKQDLDLTNIETVKALNKYLTYLKDDGRNAVTMEAMSDEDLDELEQISKSTQESSFEYKALDKNLDSATTFSEYEQKVEEIRKSMSDVKDEDFLKYVDGLGTEFSQLYSAQQRLLANFSPDNKKVQDFIKGLSAEELGQLMTVGLSGDETVDDIKLILKAVKGQLSTEDTSITMEVRGDLGSEKIADANEKLTEYTNLLDGIEKRSLLGQADTLEDIGTKQIEKNSDYLKVFRMSGAEKDELKTSYQGRIDDIYANSDLGAYENVAGLDVETIYTAMNTPSAALALMPDYYKDIQQAAEKAGVSISDFYDKEGKLKEGVTQEDIITKLFGGEEGVTKLKALRQQVEAMNKGIDAVNNALSGKEIQTTVFDLISEKSDEIITKFDIITQMGESMGDGFVIAADKVEEFASKFPELLKDYEVLSDGSIKLSQEQLQATVGAIHAEQKAKAEAQIKELDTQIELNEMKIKMMEEQNALTLKFLQGEMEADEYQNEFKATAKRQQGELQDKLNKLGVDSTNVALDNLGDVGTGVDALTEKFIKLSAVVSAVAMGEDASQVAKEFADTVVPDMTSVTQEFLDGIQSSKTMEDITKDEETKAIYDQALKSYQLNLAQINLLKSENDQLKAQKVIIESGINASLDAVNDNLAEQIDLLKDILDIYHDINNELTQIDTLLNKVNEEQDRLTGQDYVNALNDENNLLDAQIDKLKQKKKIGKTEAAGLQDKLTGYGFIFNEDGTVANYEAAMTANAQILQDAQMSGDKDAADRAQEQYDQMKETLERYEELTLNELPGIDEEIRDTFNKQIENNIKKFNYELDLHVNLNTLQKDFNTFQQNMLDENDLASKFNLQADYLFDSNAMSNITEQTNHVKDIMGEIQKMENGQKSEIFGDNIAAAYEELEKSTKDLQNSTLEVKQAFDEALNTYLSMMTQLSDAMNTQQELYDKANSILEHRKNVISMVFGEDSYKEFDMYYQKQHENNLEAIDAARASRDYWAEVMANEEEGSEIWLQAKDNWSAAVDTLNSKVEDSISNLKAKYDNAIKLIFQKTNEQITNGKGLDYLKYEWDYIKEDSAQYLDNVDRSYQISKFSANIEKQINSSSSASAKKRLADFQQQELEMLESKDKLSQYDIDRSNKKLEILQAQIALEDAQNNKSSMRLRRDSQGNYSYQFVADTSAVDKAQEDLQNSIHDLYTLDKERLQTTVDGYYNAWTKMQEELAAAMQTLQGEELEARVKQIKDHYQPLLEGYSLDITEANKHLSESALSNLSLFNDDAKISTDDIVNYLTGDKTGSKKLETEFITSLNKVGVNFEQSLPKTATAGLTEINGKIGTTQSALNSMFDQVLQEAKNFKKELGEIEKASGESFKDYTTNAGKAYEKTKELVKYQGKLITQYQNKLGISRETLKKLEELSGKFSNIATNATNAAKAALKLFNQKYTAKIDVTGFTSAIDALIEKLGEYTDKVGEITGYTGAPGIVSGGGNNNNSNLAAFQTDVLTYGSELNDAGTQWNTNKDNMNLITAGATYLDLDKKYTGQKKDYYNLLDAEGNVLARMNLKETTRKGTAAIRVNPFAGDTRAINVPKGTKILYDPTIRETANGGGYYKIWYENDNGAYMTGYVGKQVFASLDTGGYTGVWNSKQGKMAMLHEKELVLNAKDTANILSAVQLMRKQQDLVNALSLSAIAQKQAMLDRINATMIPDIATSANAIDQNVHIEASFPNVRDSRQIEEAFDNLVNMAAQYANKKLL